MMEKYFDKLIELEKRMSILMKKSPNKYFFNSKFFNDNYGKIMIISSERQSILNSVKRENIDLIKFYSEFQKYKKHKRISLW